MNCGEYECGWCFDKSDKNNSVDGACMYPEDCDINTVKESDSTLKNEKSLKKE